MSFVEFHGVSNQWQSTVVTGINAAAVSVVLYAPTQPDPATPFKFSIDTERVRCTAVALDTPTAGQNTYTISRGADGTTAAGHLAAARVIQYAEAAEITELQAALKAFIGAWTAAIGGTGSFIVGDPVNSLAVVEQSVPNMTVKVQIGGGMVSGQPVSLFAEASTGTITAPVSDPRRDLIQISQAGVVSVVTGTPAGSPTTPSASADNMALAYVTVNPGDTSLVTADITDLRTAFR